MEYSTLENVKCAALEFAIKAACGTEHSEIGWVSTNPIKLIEAAKLIEVYLKGTTNAD